MINIRQIIQYENRLFMGNRRSRAVIDSKTQGNDDKKFA